MGKNTIMNMFSTDLILMDVQVNSKEQLLGEISELLYAKGYVKESFSAAILQREKVFPTGLPTEGVKVAIPHTDAEHVIKPAIVFANLKQPIKFKEMGNGINDVDTELIFLLAVSEPEKQVYTLQKLMDVFTNNKLLRQLKDTKDVNTIYNVLVEQCS